jgi:DnaK suppressor protein
MNAEEKKRLKSKLEELIGTSEKEVIELEKLAEPISPENSLGRISRMDAINNKSVVEAALRNKKNKLSKMKVALSKIDRDDFGTCIHCKRDIQPARLIIMPESSSCIYCAGRT